MNKSVLQRRGFVSFPPFTGERVYMRKFYKDKGLPDDLARWQKTIDFMLKGIEPPGPVFLMIDQSTVGAGQTQRRPGLHVDGYWIEGVGGHGGGHRGNRNTSLNERWNRCDFSAPEAIILASDVEASRAFVGEWKGSIGEGGSVHYVTGSLCPIPLAAHTVYVGNAAMLHESLPVGLFCTRTLVRLNVPGWTPEAQ